jgi:cytochrome c
MIRRCLVLLLILDVCDIAWAQSPTFGLGTTPGADEIRSWDIAISPSGKELPQGHGTAREGAQLYVEKGCAGCHGPNGTGGKGPALIQGKDAPVTPPGHGMTDMMELQGVMALHAPFATMIWDYINRAMPFDRGGTLTPNEVYALTAFLLYRNAIIKESDVLDAQTLPQVSMPNRDGFVAPAWKPRTPRLQGYP